MTCHVTLQLEQVLRALEFSDVDVPFNLMMLLTLWSPPHPLHI